MSLGRAALSPFGTRPLGGADAHYGSSHSGVWLGESVRNSRSTRPLSVPVGSQDAFGFLPSDFAVAATADLNWSARRPKS